MSRAPFGSRMPFGGPPGGQRPDPARGPPGGGPGGHGGSQGYGDPRMAQGGGGGGGGGSRYNEKPSSGGRQVPLRVEKVNDKSLQARLIYGNLCAVAPEDFPPPRDGSDLYILLRGGQPAGEYVVTAKAIPGFPPGGISLSDPQRSWCGITMRDTFSGEIYDPFSRGGRAYLGTLDVEVGFASATKKTEAPYDEDELSKTFIDAFQNQVLSPGQRILMDVRNIPLLITVKTVGLIDLAMSTDDASKQVSREGHARGILIAQTRLNFHRDANGGFNLKPSMSKPNSNAILAPDFSFEDLGIGGLDEEFSTIFRRAFASRVFPPGLVAKMGIPHVKGLLLYGPPGTGKTLIARQIGKMLNARPPKVINGPEVLNKFVGQSEENIRKLFADAEKEYKEKGDESGLHTIIFDELDAVCKQRGSGAGGGTGVGDSVVNQLLSKLDGVDQLNNILLIGMTNRKDMIDDALLRPGRLEVHVEISLPNEDGRLEILKIHTSSMRKNGLFDNGIDLRELAKSTKNFSGAELSGLVKAAGSFAFTRHSEVGRLASVKDDVANVKVSRADFMNALTEVRPAFGVSEDQLKEAVRRGIISFSPHIDTTVRDMMRVVDSIKENPDMFSMSVLFHGPEASGKTALAAQIAIQSGVPFVKMVRKTDLAGYRDDFAKKDYLHRIFTDAYKSPSSILILDDFEDLIGWADVGPFFSHTIFALLKAFIFSEPPRGHRLLVFVTTSNPAVLRMLKVYNIFDEKVAVPAISNLSELAVVLQEYPQLYSGDINAALDQVRQRTGTDSVGVGIKTVLRWILQSERAGPEEALDVFTDKLIKAMSE